MNRNRLLIIGVMALLVAGGVSLKIFSMVRHTLSLATVSADSRVVVAAHDLMAGQRLIESDLRLVPMPGTTLPKGAFHQIEDLVGRAVILPVQANETVLATKLSESGNGLPSMIPEGMRAVSVKVNDVVSVAGFVVPGTHVDVIVTGTPNGNHDPGNVATTTVLQDVQVLAAGKKLQPDSDGKPQDVPVITLLVSPADAQLLTLASAEGRIQLALRNPADFMKKQPGVVRNAELYGGGAKPVASHPRAKVVAPAKPHEHVSTPYEVEIIRGSKRDTAKFEGQEEVRQ